MITARERIKTALPVILVFGFIGGCAYYTIKSSNDDNKPKNENWCSQVTQFDTLKHKFTKSYCQSIIFDDDSVVNFIAKDGKIWWHKDYAEDIKNKNDDGIQYDDITLKNGQRFKVLVVSEGGCKIKQKEDELLSDLSKDDDNSNN